MGSPLTVAEPHVSGQSNKAMSQLPHCMTSQDVLQELESNAEHGLTTVEATNRLIQYGGNELNHQHGVSAFKILLEQVFNAMTLVLLLALAASFGIQAWIEGGILGGVIALNVLIGFFQTLKAEKTVDSLRSLGSPTANVFRDGKTMTIQTSEIVPGDIVDLNTGDSVPADIRLITSTNLKSDEAMLTGESMPVSKRPDSVFETGTGPGDRLNVVYSSTIIVEGRGKGVVFATGMHTEIGLIAKAINAKPGRASANILDSIRGYLGEFLGLTVGTPLQRKLSQLFIWLFVCAVLCAIVVLGANKFGSREDVIIYAVTTAVGTIPVSLLLVLTVTMAAGTNKMLERNVMVRNLSSLEALGGVTDICSDKTGTITQGKMVTRKAWIAGVGTYSVETSSDVFNPTAGRIFFSRSTDAEANLPQDENELTMKDELSMRPGLLPFLRVAELANLATLEQSSETPGSWVARGTPTEIAIRVFAARFAVNHVNPSTSMGADWETVAEYAFDSEIKKMSIISRHTQSGEHQVFTKGAVERILESCDTLISPDAPGEAVPLTEQAKIDILARMESMASQGLRVLAFSYRPNFEMPKYEASQDDEDASVPREHVECHLTFLGLIGIYDPPRLESASSVAACHGAGIAVHMLTGDHPQTARAIAAEVGIVPLQEKAISPNLVMAASTLDAMSDDEIDSLPELPLVVARCSPATKVRMIDALHRRKRYAAMTGDGVNDSPSLKRSDIGIAMGSGSDVAKESSDIVLTDDNFASILNAIEEGRRIFDNIQKFILHVLAANLGFVIALLTGLAFKDSTGTSIFQLSPVQIIWMLMATGSFCETGLGFETAVPDILNRPPQDLRYGVFTPELFADILVYGLLEAACILGTFTTVIFGFNGGDLGANCNNAYSLACEPVFRARATCFATSTWIFLLFAWELVDNRRSFFDFEHGIRAWAGHLWGNKFLFFAVVVVFVMVVPALYIPGLDHKVFLHHGITWEWAVVIVGVGVFIGGAEFWKWIKRVYFRRQARGVTGTSSEESV